MHAKKLTQADKLKSIGSVFLKSREVSQHECIARLLGLPLRESNIQVKFVPTGYLNERTRMLKPRAVLEAMDDDDNNVFLPSIIDKYTARPTDLEQMCLSEFASFYSTVSAETHGDDENADDVSQDEDLLKKKICLQGGLGKMTKRKTPLVLRYYNVSRNKDSEKYFHRLLVLYLPWREESELNSNETSSYEDMYTTVCDFIQPNIQKCEPYLDAVENAGERLQTILENDGEIWDSMAPHAEQDRDEENANEDSNYQLLDTDNLTEEQLHEHEFQHEQRQTLPTKTHQVTASIKLVPTDQYYSLVRSLNDKQKQVHDIIFHWCRSTKNEEPEPFHIFLSGGAGVGKSHTIHTIYHTAMR